MHHRSIAGVAATLGLLTFLATPAFAATQTVNVTLDDKDGMMTIKLDKTNVKAGEIDFHVTSASTDLEHEFLVAKTDLPIDKLPYEEARQGVDENAIHVINELENMGPGDGGDLKLTLEPGHYVLLCNEAGHVKAGMVTAFTVQP